MREALELELGQLVNMAPALTWAGNLDFPQKEAYWLARKIHKITREQELYDKQRTKLIKKFGKPHPTNGMVGIAPDNENLGKYQEAMEELSAVVIKLDIEPIKASIFKLAKRDPVESDGEAFTKHQRVAVELKPGAIAMLMPILEWDLDEDEDKSEDAPKAPTPVPT